MAFEALVRWLHPQWGWVQPNEFIPVAEESGQILPLGRYVLDAAVSQAARWQRQHPAAPPVRVCVNASPREFSEPEYALAVLETLHRYSLSASRLGIEVTEGLFIDEADEVALQNLNELAQAGIDLSLDDFGTGYSALASLDRFPLTSLKIDRYFLRQIAAASPITEAVVKLGKRLGLTVIGEGVETREQAEHLRTLGCDAAQGFYFARPQPASAIKIMASVPLHVV